MFMHSIKQIQFVIRNVNTLLNKIRIFVQKKVTIVKLRMKKHQLKKNQYIICYSQMLQIRDYVSNHVVQLRVMNQVKQNYHLFGTKLVKINNVQLLHHVIKLNQKIQVSSHQLKMINANLMNVIINHLLIQLMNKKYVQKDVQTQLNIGQYKMNIKFVHHYIVILLL